ncbi:MAG: exoprotein [Erythrobacteraceae bacterium]|nr:exoprotein [Erythrobacteraceae bacterium]
MAPADPLLIPPETRKRRLRGLWPQKWRWRISLILLISLMALAAVAWSERKQIAGNIIDDALESNGLDATYEIVSIGPQQQVIANLVIGDPQAPDLTAERVLVDIVYSYGSPQIGRVELVRPRLYGTLRDGTLSFGALDPLLYAESDEPAGLPELDLSIVDGRARIDSDYGVIGAKLEGAGRLDSGFEGTLAATAPGLGVEGCRAEQATLYGALNTEGGEPVFEGPLRLRGLSCEGADLASADIAARLSLTDDLGAVDGDFGLAAAGLAYAGNGAEALDGNIGLLWRFAGEQEGTLGDLSLTHELAASDLTASGARIASLRMEGTGRVSDNMTRSEFTARIEGERVDLGLGDNSSLAQARRASEGTLAASLLGKLERGLASALSDGTVQGDVTLRSNEDGLRVIVPEARLRSGSGDTVLALSRVSYASRGGRFSGNILTGGANLPRINGRMEQVEGGDLALRLTMAEYRAGSDALAIPRMELRQSPSGRLAFNGMVQAEGALPGGAVRGLQVPLEGSWSAGEGLAVGQRCTDVRLASLQIYQLSLRERSVRLCPQAGSAMVRYRDALDVAMVSDNLLLEGALSDTPTRVAADRVTLRYPGPFTLTGLDAVIGAPDSAVRLTAASFDGTLGESIGGSFTGGTAAMDIVPLDLSDLSGNWSFADGALAVTEGGFTLVERTGPGPDLVQQSRFEPMTARGASLTLIDGVIAAEAPLRRFDPGQVIANVAVRHDLSSGTGRADIDVPGVRFVDKGFQPEDLSYLAKGVIAAAEGTVSGKGEVTWTPEGVDSSGTFGSDDFDFAAAFGPVRGVKGRIVFTDLLGLTTAPSQVIEIASVNPGVEALGGRLQFALTGGELITVEDGRWPFMGGTLILRPTTIDYASNGGQSYVFELVALDAASFVSQMELTNIGATGTFDGTIPMYFDAEGNGSIRGGLLISRPPGGNVSYVGELTYEDLGTMANYAFQSLRSLDYRQMSVELNGSLAGEIITNFQIDGVRQGEGAARNFVTRRLSKLPIRFKINVRSENFYQLATIVRGVFDPTLFDTESARRGLNIDGLLRDGRMVPLAPFVGDGEEDEPDETPPLPPAVPAESPRRDEPAVQPPESDNLP